MRNRYFSPVSPNTPEMRNFLSYFHTRKRPYFMPELRKRYFRLGWCVFSTRLCLRLVLNTSPSLEIAHFLPLLHNILFSNRRCVFTLNVKKASVVIVAPWAVKANPHHWPPEGGRGCIIDTPIIPPLQLRLEVGIRHLLPSTAIF